MAIMFIFFLNAIVVSLALALNHGMGFEYRSRMQNAATGGALAGAIVFESEGTAGSEAEARDYFIANLPNLNGTLYNPSNVIVTIGGGTISVTPTNFPLATYFPAPGANANVVNVSSIAVAALPGVGPVPASILLSLDLTGSMQDDTGVGPCPISGKTPCKKIEALNEAVVRLVENIASFPNSQTSYSVAVYPWADGGGSYTWQQAIKYPTFDYNSDYAFMLPILAQMGTYSMTCGACGWKKARTEVPYSPQTNKVIVHMTDGVYNTLPNNLPWVWDPPPPDWTSPIVPPLITPVHLNAAWECYNMKQENASLSIWTISFGDIAITDPANAALLEYCASPGQYIHAPTGADLDAAFQLVYQGINSVKLVQ